MPKHISQTRAGTPTTLTKGYLFGKGEQFKVPWLMFLNGYNCKIRNLMYQPFEMRKLYMGKSLSAISRGCCTVYVYTQKELLKKKCPRARVDRTFLEILESIRDS